MLADLLFRDSFGILWRTTINFFNGRQQCLILNVSFSVWHWHNKETFNSPDLSDEIETHFHIRNTMLSCMGSNMSPNDSIDTYLHHLVCICYVVAMNNRSLDLFALLSQPPTRLKTNKRRTQDGGARSQWPHRVQTILRHLCYISILLFCPNS